MRKMFLSAALALAVAGSWAFYPKTPAEPGGYMLVISTFVVPDPTMLVINPDGQQTLVTIKGKGFSGNNIDLTRDELETAVLKKLNELYAAGWRVAHITPNPFGAAGRAKNIYLLERR